MTSSSHLPNQKQTLQESTAQLSTALPYAGELDPSMAYQLLQANPTVILVDVRTKQELATVGQPHINPSQYKAIEWQQLPGMAKNPHFVGEIIENFPKETTILMLCRGAVRSKAAAAAVTSAGFTNVFDVTEGFEGPIDAFGQRDQSRGWLARGLPHKINA